jgi:hypothetical protein
VGLSLCIVFLAVLIPYGSLSGIKWLLLINFEGKLFFAGGCSVILIVTYLAGKYWGNSGNPN